MNRGDLVHGELRHVARNVHEDLLSVPACVSMAISRTVQIGRLPSLRGVVFWVGSFLET